MTVAVTAIADDRLIPAISTSIRHQRCGFRKPAPFDLSRGFCILRCSYSALFGETTGIKPRLVARELLVFSGRAQA